MWCDGFDADLPAVVPDAERALGPAAGLALSTYSRVSGGVINHPSCWNTCEGPAAFFWTDPAGRPPAEYVTDQPVVACTLWEAVRDEWVHSCLLVVDRRVVWRPPVRAFERLMYDVRGWTPLEAAERRRLRAYVLHGLARTGRVVSG